MKQTFLRTSLAVMTLAMAAVGGASAGIEMVPLKGKFEGAGVNFSGTFTQLGYFSGVIDPVTFTAVWTAANGDTVTNQTTSFTLIDEVEPNVFVYDQTLVITGGTGRFVNASGSARVSGLIDFNTGAFDGMIDGTISRPSGQ